MNPILNIAVKAARRAGKTILRYADRLDRIAVEQKGLNDFVSEVDRMAEEDIVDAIHSHYPDHAIVAEEHGGELSDARDRGKPGRKSGETPGVPTTPALEWIIDPLDGTANYLHGHPQFAVSIAVRENGRLLHGVVFDPLRDEMYIATRGQGAHLNNRRIRVTSQNRLERSLLAIGFPHRRRADFEAWMHNLRALLPRVSDLRRCGAASLDLAYVACGRVDGFWESGLGAWDIAAGSLLVREAGGLVADFEGEQNFLHTGQVIAANRMIFNDLMLTVTAGADAARERRSAPAAS